MMTDPIADMLTRIRNAHKVGKTEVAVPHSKLKYAIAQLLLREGYLAAVEKVRAKLYTYDELQLRLVSKKGGPGVLHALKRVSKPGQRVYFGYADLPTNIGGRGLTIVSTPQGIMTGKEARQRKLGGELLCAIY